MKVDYNMAGKCVQAIAHKAEIGCMLTRPDGNVLMPAGYGMDYLQIILQYLCKKAIYNFDQGEAIFYEQDYQGTRDHDGKRTSAKDV